MDDVSLTVRRLILGAACLAGASPLLAAASPDSELEEVVVTGSRVRGAEVVGSAVTSLGREDIENAGQVSLDRMLKELPQNFDLGVSENSRAQSGGSGNIVYGNTVNLRGIGPYATLIIVDGHRVTNNTRSTDPSIFPTLGVERVEVVADGASAIYGSDAVAGVVNVIPRRSLDGVEVFARGGIADDFSEYLVGAAWGTVFERGQFMLAYEHVFRDNLSGDDRDFFRADQTSRGGRDYRTTRCSPGTLLIGSTTYAIPAGGLTAANVSSLTPGSANRCDELIGQDLFPQQTYDSFASTFSYQISPRVKLLGDAFYSRRRFDRAFPESAARLTVPETNAWFVRPEGFTGTSYIIDYSFAGELPRNDADGFARNWQITPALQVELGGDWQAEAVVGYGKTSDNSEQWYGLNNAALNAALASSDPATAFDPYGLHRTSPSVLQNLANQIFLAPTKSDFKGYELRLNGTLARLPGGNLGLAAGYERQDIGVDLGNARGGPDTAIGWRHFDRTVDSAYAELQIPLFGPGNARPGFERLTVNAAIRYDDYSDVGDTTNAKFGATWRPVGGFALRGSYGTSFRAPLITQIYGNSNNLYVQNYQNPAGGPTIQGVALSGENRGLGPEEATTWSVGFDWDIGNNLRIGATYFDVHYKNQVEAYLSNLAILAREADFEGTGIIIRGAEASARVQEWLDRGLTVVGALPGGSAANVDLFVDGRNQNLGVSDMKGIDFTAAYSLPTTSHGRWSFNLNGTWLTSYEVAITPAAPMVDRLNTIFNPLKLKMRAGVSWNNGPWSANATITRVHGYQNNAVTPVEGVSPYTPVDLAFGVDLGSWGAGPAFQDLNLGFEVRNAFDEDPPYVNVAPSANGSGGYDATVTNPVGRLFALSLRKKW
jgi:iron complex outermembrane receptor protein